MGAMRTELAGKSAALHKVALALCLLLLPLHGGAHPTYWALGTAVDATRDYSALCTSHPPSEPERYPLSGACHHLVAIPDRTAAFTLSVAGTFRADVCPGQTHTVTVSFTSLRFCLLTASSDGVDPVFGKPTNAACPNRQVFDSYSSNGQELQKKFTTTMAVPCGTAAIKLEVTSAEGPLANFQRVTAVFPVNTTCANKKCPALPPSAPPFPAPPPDLPPANASSNASGPPPPPLQPSQPAASNSNSSCQPSALGYQCVVQAPGGGPLIHYSLGTPLPVNVVTQGLHSSAAGRRLLAEQDNSTMLHIAAQAVTKGYTALGFPANAGVMVPSDAVIGWVDDTTGVASVKAYHITSRFLGSSNVVTGWAKNLAVLQLTNGTTITAFSREIDDTGAPVSPSLLLSGLQLNWAVSQRDALTNHVAQGSLKLDLESGSSSAVSSGTQRWIEIHGILMSVAFAFALPLGALVSRNKWLLGHPQLGSPSIRAWFIIHLVLQLLGVALLISGFVIAFVKFPNTDSYTLGFTHKLLGIIVMSMAVIQVLVAFVRPHPDATKRFMWAFAHKSLGYSTLLAGWAQVYIGIIFMHDLGHGNWVPWLAAVTSSLVVLIALGMIVEVLGWRSEEPQTPELKQSDSMARAKCKVHGELYGGGSGGASRRRSPSPSECTCNKPPALGRDSATKYSPPVPNDLSVAPERDLVQEEGRMGRLGQHYNAYA